MNLQIYKYLSIAGISIALLAGAFFYGRSIGYDVRDLEAQTAANEQWAEYQKQLNDITEQNRLNQIEASTREAIAWEKYNEAQQNYDNAVSDADGWRVRVKSCSTATGNVSGNTKPTNVGNEPAERLEKLPAAVTRGLAAVGQRADQCEAKLKAMQDWAQVVIDSQRKRD